MSSFFQLRMGKLHFKNYGRYIEKLRSSIRTVLYLLNTTDMTRLSAMITVGEVFPMFLEKIPSMVYKMSLFGHKIPRKVRKKKKVKSKNTITTYQK